MADIHAQDIARVERKVDELAAKVDGLLEAWTAAKGMVRFIKVLGQTAAALGTLWGLLQLGSHK